MACAAARAITSGASHAPKILVFIAQPTLERELSHTSLRHRLQHVVSVHTDAQTHDGTYLINAQRPLADLQITSNPKVCAVKSGATPRLGPLDHSDVPPP